MLKNGRHLLKNQNKYMKKELIETLQEKLKKEKLALEKELSSFAKEDKNIKNNWDTRYPNHDNGDMEEEADEVQEYDNLLSLEHNLELRLRDVNSALEKIKEGGYGTCQKCGKEIKEDRLLVCPEAKFCMTCNK